MATEYWVNKDKVTTPQDEVNLIFQTVDFTLAESGRLPKTGKEYCDFEQARLMTEALVTIMEEKAIFLDPQSISHINKISNGLQEAYFLARSEASDEINNI